MAYSGKTMSMYFLAGNEILSFREFLQTESIQPRVVEFGTDLKNHQWLTFESGHTNRHIHVTFFKTNEYYYFVGLEDNGEISFDSSDYFDLDRANDIEYLGEIFTGKVKKTKEFLQNFGRIIYVVLEGADKFKVNKIKFEPADPSLGEAYKAIVKNKFLNQTLKQKGYEYIGLQDRYFTYERINDRLGDSNERDN